MGYRALRFSAEQQMSKEEREREKGGGGASIFLSTLIATLLAGPLTWLGLVDAVTRPDRTGALRVRRDHLIPSVQWPPR